MRLNPKEPYLCLEKERFCVVVREKNIIFLSLHRVSPFSRGVIFTPALVSLALLSLEKKWGLLVV